jgi:hypothetical protein
VYISGGNQASERQKRDQDKELSGRDPKGLRTKI